MGNLELKSRILKGSNEPISNRQLTKTAKQVLKQVEYINCDSAIASVYITYKTYPTAVLRKNRMSFMSAPSHFAS